MFKRLNSFLLLCIMAGKPGISFALQTIIATFGSPVVLYCNNASNETVAEVLWESSTANGNISYSPDINGISGSTPENPPLTISVASTFDSGLYTCNIKTHNDTIQRHTTILKIEGAIPNVLITSTPLSGIYGTPVTIHVEIDATPPVDHIYWTKENNNGQIKTITSRATGYEGGNTSSPSLTISYPRFNDKGMYRCYARNAFGLGYSHQVYMNIEGGFPRVSIDSLNYKVPFGSNVTLNCNVTAFPFHNNIYWHKNRDNVITTITHDTVGVTGSTIDIPVLTIQYVTTSDTGSYTCFAENSVGVGNSRSTFLTVTGGRPMVEVKSVMYSTIYGTPITLHCDVNGNPPFTKVYWQKKTNTGLWLIITSGTVGVQGLNVTHPSLTVMFPVTSDAGEYICFAVNAIGSSSSLPTLLRVTGEKPVVTVTSNNYTANYGNELTLRCTVSANPVHINVYWEFIKNGVVRKITRETTGKRGVTWDNPSLTINFVTISDDGFYTCHASNIVGTGVSRPVRLSVNAAIPFVTVTLQHYSVNEGDGISLVCKVRSEPVHTHVYWQKENNGLITILKEGTTGIIGVTKDEPSLTFNPTRRKDSGYYTCFAMNAIGLGFSRDVTLEVKPFIEETTTTQTPAENLADNYARDFNTMYAVCTSLLVVCAIVMAVVAVRSCIKEKEQNKMLKLLNSRNQSKKPFDLTPEPGPIRRTDQSQQPLGPTSDVITDVSKTKKRRKTPGTVNDSTESTKNEETSSNDIDIMIPEDRVASTNEAYMNPVFQKDDQSNLSPVLFSDFPNPAVKKENDESEEKECVESDNADSHVNQNVHNSDGISTEDPQHVVPGQSSSWFWFC